MIAAILHIIQHSLGVDQYGRGDQYRNYFATDAGSIDHPVCMEAVGLGLMSVRRAKYEPYGGMDVFAVTDEGKRWMADNSPKPPKLTRSQRRYQDYLAADWFTGNFRDWINYWRPAQDYSA